MQHPTPNAQYSKSGIVKVASVLTMALLLIACHAKAQVKVYQNNSVKVGNANSTLPYSHFQACYDSYFQCLPANSGLYIQNFQNNYEPGTNYNTTGSTTYYEPSIVGQWGNAAWLGTWQTPFWQVRSYEVWANNVLCSSDSTHKENIQPLDSASEKLMLLKPVTYDHRAGVTDNTPEEKEEQIIENGKDQMGLLAQELAEVYPN